MTEKNRPIITIVLAGIGDFAESKRKFFSINEDKEMINKLLEKDHRILFMIELILFAKGLNVTTDNRRILKYMVQL